MGHVLLVTSEMAGRINIMGELAHRLEAAGHTAAIASPVDIRERVEALGARYVDIVPATPAPAVPTGEPAVGISSARRAVAFIKRLGQVRTIAARRNAKVDAMAPDALAAAIGEEQPDLVLLDVELPMHIMVAASTGVPVALWTSMLSLWKRPGLPPLGSSIVPGRGWSGSRAGITTEWLRFRAWKWLRRQRHRITRLGEDQISVLRTLASRVDFPFDSEADVNQWLIPCTYRSLPVVSFNALELEFPHSPQPTCTYAGPVLPSVGGRAHPDVDTAEVARRLARLAARRRSGESAAIVYCSFGAWHKGDDRAFLNRILAAVGEHPEWDVVVGLGGRIDPADLGEVPANVHVFPWAPQLEVLAIADGAVHHGGISTVNECITNGVPMVVYPFDFMDQPGNAARIEFHGIGLVGDRTADTVGEIRSRIEHVLSRPSIRAAIAEMQDSFASYRSEDRALRFIEGRLAAPP